MRELSKKKVSQAKLPYSYIKDKNIMKLELSTVKLTNTEKADINAAIEEIISKYFSSYQEVNGN